MIRLMEWIVMVALPAGCAVFLAIGLSLHLMGWLGPLLAFVAPSAKTDMDPTCEP